MFLRALSILEQFRKNELTIPKLELLGILIGTRAANFVKKELNLYQANILIWSDSEIALHWIGSSERQPIFVANRLKEIRKCEADFRHVATNSNPADHATRGLVASELEQLDIWWNGPKWFKNPESKWPKSLLIRPPKDDGEELIAQFAAPLIEAKPIKMRPEIDPTKFSNWNRMIFSFMYLLRFICSLIVLTSHECANKFFGQIFGKWVFNSQGLSIS